HVTDRGRRVGPIGVDEIRGFLSDGRLSASAIVWREGMTEWGPVTLATGPFVPQPRVVPPVVAPAVAPPPPPSYGMERQWLINDDGRQLGPYALHDLAALLAAGHVSLQALGWRDGNPQWLPISSVIPPVYGPL